MGRSKHRVEPNNFDALYQCAGLFPDKTWVVFPGTLPGMNETDRAYVAGVFDAKLRYRERTAGRGYEVWLAHPSKEWLEGLSKKCDGRGSVRKAGKGYRWAIYSQADIFYVLSQAEHFMTVKRRRAQHIAGVLDPKARKSRKQFAAEAKKNNSRSMYTQ